MGKGTDNCLRYRLPRVGTAVGDAVGAVRRVDACRYREGNFWCTRIAGLAIRRHLAHFFRESLKEASHSFMESFLDVQ